MTAKQPHSTERQIALLYERLKDAQWSFDLWEGLLEARCDSSTVEVMNKYASFFVGIERSLFNSYIVSLYSILETGQKVSINSLIRSAEEAIKYKKDDETNSFIIALKTKEIKDEIDSSKIKLKPTWLKIKTIRNEAVGHQSIQKSTKESFDSAKLTAEAVKEFISDAQNLLGKISSNVSNNCLAFNIKSKESLNSLLSDLKLNTGN